MKYKNKAERNAGTITDAMKIFSQTRIILERPDGMNREEYRVIRKLQSEVLKKLFPKPPLRKLQGVMNSKEPLARTKKGLQRVAKRMIKQRKSG